MTTILAFETADGQIATAWSTGADWEGELGLADQGTPPSGFGEGGFGEGGFGA